MSEISNTTATISGYAFTDRLGAVYRANKSKFALAAVIAVLVAITSSQSDVFLTWSNFRNILIQVAIVGILAVGTTLLMVSGGLDLSIGSNASFSGMVMGILMLHGTDPVLAVVAGLAVASGVGAINGVLAANSTSHPFIVTLGMMTLLQGGALLISGIPISEIPDGYLGVASADVLGLPLMVIVFFGVALTGHMILRYTKWGRWLYAIGGSESASRLAGISVSWVKVATYAFNGLIVGVAAALLVSQLSSAQPHMGQGLELAAIAAVAVGGTPLAGGRGDIFGTLLGVLLLGVIGNTLNLLSISSDLQYVLQGLVIIVAVMAQRGK